MKGCPFIYFFSYIKNMYEKKHSPGGDRTHDLLLRRQTRYPLRYKAFKIL